MRKASTYIALCGLVGVWGIAAATVAGAAMTRHAQAASGHATRTTSQKFGTIHVKLLGSTADQLVTDGARWAAYEPVLGTTRLLDTKSGRKIDRMDPEGCTGGLTAIGGGELLYECKDPECPEQTKSCRFTPGRPEQGFESRRYVVEDISGDVQHVMPSTSRVPVGYPETHFHLTAIGSQWAAGKDKTEEYKAGGRTFFVNWHTGLLVYQGEKPSFSGANVKEEPPSAEEEVENLNRRGLLQPLCPPLERPLNGEYEATSKYGPFVYEPPFALVGPVGSPEVGFENAPEVPLQLWRCGTHDHWVLPRGSSSAQIGGYVLSWIVNTSVSRPHKLASYERNTGYVTHLIPHGRWHGTIYQFTGLPKYSEPNNTRLQHTATLVCVTVGTNNYFINHVVEHGRVYVASLPWTRRRRG